MKCLSNLEAQDPPRDEIDCKQFDDFVRRAVEIVDGLVKSFTDLKLPNTRFFEPEALKPVEKKMDELEKDLESYRYLVKKSFDALIPINMSRSKRMKSFRRTENGELTQRAILAHMSPWVRRASGLVSELSRIATSALSENDDFSYEKVQSLVSQMKLSEIPRMKCFTSIFEKIQELVSLITKTFSHIVTLDDLKQKNLIKN